MLLDAGNTLVFLDHGALSDISQAAGEGLGEAALREAEAPAKRAYERRLREGGSHDSGWLLFMREIFLHAGASADASERLAQAAWQAHIRRNLWRRVPADLTPALQRLRAHGLRLGVVSNAEGTVQTLLEEVGLGPHLDLVVDSCVEGVQKPDPEIFRRALERLQVDADQCVYAGDIPDVDVRGAQAAGIAAVLVDPFDHYPNFDEAPRVASVRELTERLL